MTVESRPAQKPAHGRSRAALSGVLAVAVALGVAELAAGLLPDARSLVLSVGDLVVDHVPGWLEREVITRLGTADKPFLIGSILVVSAVLGALLGLLAARRFLLAAAGLCAVALLGVLAALEDPRTETALAPILGLAYAGAGILTLHLLLRARPDRADTTSPPDEPAVARGMDRQRFFWLAGGALATAVLAGVAGRLLVARDRIGEIRASIRLPRPSRPAPPAPSAASLDIRGLTPLYVPNERFYRVDTALTVPRIDPASWSLHVGGRVKRPFSLSYDELVALPQIEADITLACVSNPVGGHLVGNARWQGVPLTALLERARPKRGATQVLGRSVDGFTAGFPTLTALALEEAMVAVGMNGEPLPLEHGFPARLLVPGLYGYVSATKWLSEIELTSFEDDDGYWIPRGWAKRGPIVTQSRIDVPADSSRIRSGRQPIAGVAWAPTRGIDRVEIRFDDGAWLETELAAPLDIDSWRQWVYHWDAEPGEYVISVRATDGNDDVQTPVVTPAFPDGATGHDTIEVLVTEA